MMPECFQSTHLSFRPFNPSDGAAVFRYWQSDPGWVAYNDSVPSGFTTGDAEHFVEAMIARDRHQQPNWALVHDGNVVGVVSASFSPDYQEATIGYGIHAALRGRGLIGEAVSEVINLAFSIYKNLEVIKAHTDSHNTPSIRVLEKLGFVEVKNPYDQEVEETEGSTFSLEKNNWHGAARGRT